MDTTEKNIKMCEKAEEIQESRPQDKDVWYLSPKYNLGSEEVYCGRTYSVIDETAHEFEKGKVYTFAEYKAFGYDFWADGYHSIDTKLFIWLPCQDQLQGMIGLTWHDFDSLCWSITSELLEQKKTYPSKEQAGLMALMYLKYKKVWNDETEEWITST